MSSSITWKRPESVKFPSVWSEFEGIVEINGKKRKYWIQDVSEEYKDDLLNVMCSQYTKDEPFCKYGKLLEDQSSVIGIRKLWNEIISQNLALICLTKDENNVTKIAAANITGIATKYDKENMHEIQGEKLKMFYDACVYSTNYKNVFDAIKSDKYLNSWGLLVMPEFRGEGLGLAILNARKNLCLAVGLKGTGTCFSSIISQKVAAKAGFKVLSEVTYDELEKVMPHCVFPGITSFTKSMKFMYMVYD